jgi:hypothetical protein
LRGNDYRADPGDPLAEAIPLPKRLLSHPATPCHHCKV